MQLRATLIIENKTLWSVFKDSRDTMLLEYSCVIWVNQLLKNLNPITDYNFELWQKC